MVNREEYLKMLEVALTARRKFTGKNAVPDFVDAYAPTFGAMIALVACEGHDDAEQSRSDFEFLLEMIESHACAAFDAAAEHREKELRVN